MPERAMSLGARLAEPARILIADDHAIFRDGLRRLLDAESSFDVVGQAADGWQAIELARTLAPDVVLLDLAMPQVAGLGTIATIAALPTAPRVLLLAAAIDTTSAMAALRLGARGVVLKISAIEILFTAIREVMQGHYWVVGGGIDTLESALATFIPQPTTTASFGLTPREMEVVAAVSSGRTNAEIAREFRISEETVKHHVNNVFNKTGASNRLELALFAINHGLLR